QKAVLKISSSPSVAISGSEANFTLKPLEVKHTNFTASALDIADANIKFDLDANGQKFSNDVEFDIISQFPRSKLFHVSYGDKPVTLKIDPSYKEIYTHISATPNAFSLADELYLYPYGCTEQLTSKMVAVDYVARKDSNKTLTNRVNEYASRILSRLKPSGSFGYWSAHGVTNYYASIYASDVLLELDARYKFLSNKQRSLIFSALKSDYEDQATLRVYADFVLDQYGKLDDDEINFIYDNGLYDNSPMARIAMAAILKKHNMTTEFNFMREKINQMDYDYAEDGAGLTFASDIRDAAFKLYAFGKAGIKDDNTARTVDAIIRDLKNINNTQERASVIRGFDEYFKDSKKDISFALKYDGEAKNFNSPLDTKLAVKDGAIEFTPMSGNGELFFTVLGFGYESAAVKHNPLSINRPFDNDRDKKVEIYREFLDARGNIVDLNKLKVGQKIYSKISWRANHYLYNFAIDEAMPSCFEAVNERLGSAAQARPEGFVDSVAIEHTEYLYDRVLHFPKSGYFYYDPQEGYNSTGIIYTPINVIMSGSCALPAISIEDMQYERVNNYDLQTLKFKVAR
uniref:alpha-2-macroglobulin family protein n=1 Tax=uncultured Campylobacter sp. TaxID=218934 RepID=UPI0026267CED